MDGLEWVNIKDYDAHYECEICRMRTFERYFRYNTSLDQIDKYVRLVLKTFDPDDDIEVTYEDQSEAQFVRIRVYDRVLN